MRNSVRIYILSASSLPIFVLVRIFYSHWFTARPHDGNTTYINCIYMEYMWSDRTSSQNKNVTYKHFWSNQVGGLNLSTIGSAGKQQSCKHSVWSGSGWMLFLSILESHGAYVTQRVSGKTWTMAGLWRIQCFMKTEIVSGLLSFLSKDSRQKKNIPLFLKWKHSAYPKRVRRWWMI